MKSEIFCSSGSRWTPCRINSRSAKLVCGSSVLMTATLEELPVSNGPSRWRFSARYDTIFRSWPSRQNLSKNASRGSNSKLASWEIYVLALCLNNTTFVAVPVASARPLPQSSTARIIRLALWAGQSSGFHEDRCCGGEASAGGVVRRLENASAEIEVRQAGRLCVFKNRRQPG